MMRRAAASVLVLASICLGGCFSGESVRPAAFLERVSSPRTPIGPDGVMVDIVLIERPLGDQFLNEELWRSTDRLAVGLDSKALLDENGICLGQVIGQNPAELQKLLDAERYHVGKRRQLLPAGTPTSVTLGPPVAECTFHINSAKRSDPVNLDLGQCTLRILPTLTKDGRTRLNFTPEVFYGSEVPDYQVAPDRSGFVFQCKRPCKTYDSLSWEVTLTPNQYLVVGTYFDENAPEDAAQTLGSRFFLIDNGRTFVQRLLVIRTARGEGMEGIRRQESEVRGQGSEVRNQETRAGSEESALGGLGNRIEAVQTLPPAVLCLQTAGR